MSTASEQFRVWNETRASLRTIQEHLIGIVTRTTTIILDDFGFCEDCGPDEVYFASELTRGKDELLLCKHHATREQAGVEK